QLADRVGRGEVQRGWLPAWDGRRRFGCLGYQDLGDRDLLDDGNGSLPSRLVRVGRTAGQFGDVLGQAQAEVVQHHGGVDRSPDLDDDLALPLVVVRGSVHAGDVTPGDDAGQGIGAGGVPADRVVLGQPGVRAEADTVAVAARVDVRLGAPARP